MVINPNRTYKLVQLSSPTLMQTMDTMLLAALQKGHHDIVRMLI